MSSSGSALFPTPSLSVSNHSFGSKTKASTSSLYPSLSSSGSIQSGIESPSKSTEREELSNGSVPQAISSFVKKPSPSSSLSKKFNIPSESLSVVSPSRLSEIVSPSESRS